jgi:hypothetical protein
MNIPSFVVPIRGSEVSCLLDAGVGEDLRVSLRPSGLQRHCSATAVPMVVVVDPLGSALLINWG